MCALQWGPETLTVSSGNPHRYIKLTLENLYENNIFSYEQTIIFSRGYPDWEKIVRMRKIAEMNYLPQRCIWRKLSVDYPCYARFGDFLWSAQLLAKYWEKNNFVPRNVKDIIFSITTSGTIETTDLHTYCQIFTIRSKESNWLKNLIFSTDKCF